MASAVKVSSGTGGAVLEDVPHLTDWLPDLAVSKKIRPKFWAETFAEILTKNRATILGKMLLKCFLFGFVFCRFSSVMVV